MSLYILPKEKLGIFVEALKANFRVVGPTQTETGYAFEDIDHVEQLQLDYNTTILPPKKFFLPQREVLFEFHSDTHHDGRRKIDVRPVYQDVEPTVIFGVHTCDMNGIMLYDKVFAEGFRDEHYVARREQIYVIGVECLHPCDEASFCKDMGTLTAPPIYDLHMTDVGPHYMVDTGTPKGERLLLDHIDVAMARKEDIQELGRVLSAKWPQFKLRLKISKDQTPSLLALGYNARIWNELGERCLACGSCTNVCPTCFCFDVHDESNINMQDGERVRLWDSCQLAEFALVAGGHNFRQTKASRVRHRIMRKGKYIKQVHNLLGCTGCGRCERACLVNITIPGTLNALHEEMQLESGI
ncbi:MAG TPA: 4Fe-4S dicluster domain-containing protein [Aggregatilineaceae bacterium]|nr:4Fe-4S dicluster domain-containing protein [Aggregatilineaceae bacterium]